MKNTKIIQALRLKMKNIVSKNDEKNPDNERDHGDADEILCDILKSYGEHELVEDYEKIGKWYA